MRTTAYRWVPIAVGLVFGGWFVATSAYRDQPLWTVWAPLVVALTTAAGVIFGYGVDRWRELTALGASAGRTARQVTAAAATALVPLVVSLVLPVTDTRAAVRAAVLLTVTVIGGAPAAAVLYRIRSVAVGRPTGGRGAEAELLLRLRRVLQRILAAVGTLVALSTVATAAVIALGQQGARAAGRPVPQTPAEVVVVFGGAGSLLVALIYAPAAVAVSDRARRLCDELFPLRGAEEPADILAVAESRRTLESFLGADRGLLADLQTGLVVLAPLLASGFAVFLPG
ncbi:MAG TPA: hypothetical protein VGP36_15910 [Mycobacteriales bacterium]|nr:hypothetical protein [Mycobacteriales bacterium]